MELRENYVIGMNIALNDANLLGGRDHFAEITPGIASGGKNPSLYRSFKLMGSQPENKEQWDKIAGIFNATFEATDMSSEQVFNDISGHWAEKKILTAHSGGYISGMGDGSYAPESTLTVAQAIELASKIWDLPKTEYKNNIADVSAEDWFAPAVAAADSAGMLFEELFKDGSLRPERNITREEFAKLILSGKETEGKFKMAYADMDEISDWAVGAVDAAFRSKYMTGDENNLFNPKKPLTRAEAAAVIVNITTK